MVQSLQWLSQVPELYRIILLYPAIRSEEGGQHNPPPGGCRLRKTPHFFPIKFEARARRPVRTRLPPPPRTLLPAGLLHALPNCASVQRLSAAVSEGLCLWLRAGARFPRLSTARLRLLETVSRRRMQRPVRERRRRVRKHLARVCSDRTLLAGYNSCARRLCRYPITRLIPKAPPMSRSPSSKMVVMPPEAFQRRLSSGNIQRSRSSPVVQSRPTYW